MGFHYFQKDRLPMVSNNIYRGRTLRIAVGTLLVIFVFAGGAGALSNSGGGSWAYIRDITISNPGAALSDYCGCGFCVEKFPKNIESNAEIL